MKQYKRNSSILVEATLIALFVVACEKNEPKVHELVGTWISTSGTIYYGASVASADSSATDPFYTNTVLTVVFREDNTGSIKFSDGEYVDTEEITWSTSGNELFVLDEDGTPVSSTPNTYDITGNTLTITDHWEAGHVDPSEPEQWRTITLQKQ